MFGGTWNEQSTNFGTPICDVASCGLGGGTGPFAGTFWVWIGGIAGSSESASVGQTVTIPPGVATLSFEFEIPSCDGFGFDTFGVSMDNVPLYSTDDLDPACGNVGYKLIQIDVSQFADGGQHTLSVSGSTDSFFTPTNFMVDNVQLIACQ